MRPEANAMVRHIIYRAQLRILLRAYRALLTYWLDSQNPYHRHVSLAAMATSPLVRQALFLCDFVLWLSNICFTGEKKCFTWLVGILDKTMSLHKYIDSPSSKNLILKVY